MDKKIFILVLVYLALAAQGLEERDIKEELNKVYYRFWTNKMGSKKFYDVKQKSADKIASAIKKKGFNRKKEVKIIIHGYTRSAKSIWRGFAKAYLAAKKTVNMFVVDWSKIAKLTRYDHALASVDEVGDRICRHLIKAVLKAKSKHRRIHIIGHGLGAFVAGNAVKCLKKKDAKKKAKKIGRITALDPDARGSNNALNKNDTNVLDVIHTNGGYLNEGCVGKAYPFGHVDFFVNRNVINRKGEFTDQHVPGCNDKKYNHRRDLAQNYDREGSCSHEAALKMYKESIRYPESFESRQCLKWKGKRGHGFVVAEVCNRLGGYTLHMGENIEMKTVNQLKLLTLTGDGRFFLTTTDGSNGRYSRSGL